MAFLDFRGFANSLRIKPFGATYEVLIRRGIGIFTSIATHGLLDWVNLFRYVISRRRFLLIVLDDARYDAFSMLYRRYLRGHLTRAHVPPPNTYGWLPRAFSVPEFESIRIFYAGLSIESHDIMIGRFVPKNRNVEVFGIRPRLFKDLGTVHPSEVNDVVFRIGLSGRDIVWYAQPHFPWITDPELSRALIREALLHDFVPPDIVADKLRRLKIDRKRVVNAYYGNLALVLTYVGKLLNYVRSGGVKYDVIAVTSDHGELLGEYGLYLHQEYNLPQLVVVPWLWVTL